MFFACLRFSGRRSWPGGSAGPTWGQGKPGSYVGELCGAIERLQRSRLASHDAPQAGNPVRPLAVEQIARDVDGGPSAVMALALGLGAARRRSEN
jgi:hypothetical protein